MEHSLIWQGGTGAARAAIRVVDFGAFGNSAGVLFAEDVITTSDQQPITVSIAATC